MNGKYTCLRCGKTFNRKFNMNRHLQTFHKEEDNEDGSNDEMENDRADESSHASDRSSDEEEVQSEGSEANLDARLEKNEVFRHWLDTARDEARQARTERVEKYLAQGMEEADAREKANWKTTPEIKTEFFDNYETHLWEYKTLEFNDVHRDILHTMEDRLTDGVDIHHAIKRAVAKHKPEFEGLFQELDEDSEEEAMEEEDPDPNAGVAYRWRKMFSACSKSLKNQ